MHILLPVTDKCPPRISGMGRTTVDTISWSVSAKAMWLSRDSNCIRRATDCAMELGCTYLINLFMLSGLFYLSFSTCPSPTLGCLACVFPISLPNTLYFVQTSCPTKGRLTNSADPDQTPQIAASGLGLHCLSISFLWDTRLKKYETFS